ncbi:MAG: T9SS type A sorting domain-containing protein [Bacteroidota bacterium]
MKKINLLLAFSFLITQLYSQQHVITSGENNQSSSGKIAYSVGVINYKNATGSGGSSFSGPQIPFEVTPVLSIDNQDIISVDPYPNPAVDYISITLKDREDFSFKVFDMTGKEVSGGIIRSLQTDIDLRSLDSSIYMLSIYKDNITLKTYKIIKK